MVDQLEQENPGCFDDPDHTFIDLYRKSGLYPAEIVKRLYRSQKMRELFPDGNDRLRHIFEKQVYGLADALPYAKEGKLQELLDTLYGEEG